jgi:hypothetical protein
MWSLSRFMINSIKKGMNHIIFITRYEGFDSFDVYFGTRPS